MTQLASTGQLRAGILRWTLVFAPAILLLGTLSGVLSQSGAENPWFASLTKPAIFPPPALFGIVWSVLYVMMGWAFALVFCARGAQGRRPAIIAFVIQLAINLAWSPVFFAMHQMRAALMVIGLLLIALIVTIVLFHRLRPFAAWLLLPYLGWVLFATVLNWEFIRANPDADGREVSGAAATVQLGT